MRKADGSWLVDGGVTIRDLNRTWLALPDEDASTLAGLILLKAALSPAQVKNLDFMISAFVLLNAKVTG